MTSAETSPPGEAEPEAPLVQGAEAPRLPEGQDVRIGPEQSDEPQAGSSEPTD
jgi:hypothetical protein